MKTMKKEQSLTKPGTPLWKILVDNLNISQEFEGNMFNQIFKEDVQEHTHLEVCVSAGLELPRESSSV